MTEPGESVQNEGIDYPTDILLKGLAEPLTAITYAVSRRLATLFPEQAMIEGDACPFDLMQFVNAGHCTLKQRRDHHNCDDQPSRTT